VITDLGEDVLKGMMAAKAGNGEDRDIAILDLSNNTYWQYVIHNQYF
jgi:hypothetical protein